jgi:hypothetical protein
MYVRPSGYPGGAFDPLKLTSTPSAKEDYKLKEIKNGRLAMLAFMGFVAQYAATGKGPIDNLFDVSAHAIYHPSLCMSCTSEHETLTNLGIPLFYSILRILSTTTSPKTRSLCLSPCKWRFMWWDDVGTH